ncbi:hypothetical protein DERP_001176 [Dermatophagoides pteronyssinus]|uniref:Uncharacterized protein n=1 Tax=Dermatophagoides pteronyssinus TaxID=6956 RepID=A0ABQ8JEF9_DERPT|nr:hypothetical protein DERP_001176 [Dermatophagoides pteronyssinus]
MQISRSYTYEKTNTEMRTERNRKKELSESVSIADDFDLYLLLLCVVVLLLKESWLVWSNESDLLLDSNRTRCGPLFRIYSLTLETSSSTSGLLFVCPLLTFLFPCSGTLTLSGFCKEYSSIKRHFGVTISLYCNRSTRVVAAILYGITMLLMSKACCSLRRRRFNGAINDE